MSNLVRWQEPFYALRQMQREIDRLFEDILMPARSPWFRDLPSWWETPFAGDNLAVDMYETDDALHIEAAMPGVNPENVEIEEHDGILTIRARQSEENTWDNGRWQVRERYLGAWQRAVRLPVDVKSHKADAVLEDGVLHITLPKVRPARRKVNRISVKAPKLRLPKLGGRKKIKVNA